MYRPLAVLLSLLLSVGQAMALPTPATTGINPTDCPNWDAIKTTTAGRTINVAGTVIENELVNGELHIDAADVVIRCVKINSGDLYGIDAFNHAGATGAGLLLENVHIENCRNACILARGTIAKPMIIDKAYMNGAIKDLLKIEGNVVLQNSYLRLDAVPGEHNDAIQTSRGDNIDIKNNTIIGPHLSQTSAYILKTDFASSNKVRIMGNFMSGGAFTLYLRDGDFGAPTNVVVRDNIFGKGTSQFGPNAPYSIDTSAATCMEWYNNTFDDGSALTNPGSISAIGSCEGFDDPPETDQAAAPTITPNGAISLENQINVTMATTETAPVSIYFTIDGTDPTVFSTLYEEPFGVASTQTIKAITVKQGLLTSNITTAVFEVNDFSAEVAWKFFDFEQQTTRFTATLEVIPGADPMDIVIGLGPDLAVDDYVDQAAQLRLSTAGVFDARNGGAYQAENVLAYDADTTYEAFFDIDIAAKTYTLVVTPAGGASTVIAQDYAFRTEQAAANEITTLSFRTTGDTATVRQFRVLEQCE